MPMLKPNLKRSVSEAAFLNGTPACDFQYQRIGLGDLYRSCLRVHQLCLVLGLSKVLDS